MIYGLWHPERGWWWCYMVVWTTPNRLIALVQCDMVRRGVIGSIKPDDKWLVRSLLNWEVSEGPEKIRSFEWQHEPHSQ